MLGLQSAPMEMPAATGTGRCLCGGVRYRVHGELRDVVNCHCHRCRRSTGHFMAATGAATDDLAIEDRGSLLRWYDAPDEVQYGFCVTCGSTMFWRALAEQERVSIAAGTLDSPTGLRTVEALFVDSASDYHNLDQSLPSHPADWE